MKILVVGGAGYIGGALTDILSNTDHKFLVYDRLLYEENYQKSVPFVSGDIRDHDKLKKYLDWADVVVWLAALVGDPACALSESLTVEINNDPVVFLRENYHGRIIYMSSCSVYGTGDSVLTEDSNLNPLSFYAKSKIEDEKVLVGSNYICFRLGTLHGISDNFSRIRFDLVVNTLVMRAVFHNKIVVFGGDQYRPLLHVRDVAKAISMVLDKGNIGIYNLHAENMTIINLARQIKDRFPELVIETSEIAFQDNRNYQVSSAKAKSELGFNPSLKLDDAINELKNLLEEGRIKDSFIKRFSNYLYLKPLLEEYSSPLGKEVKINI
jgi:nucleoside-diphosphate-sugar epimerase